MSSRVPGPMICCFRVVQTLLFLHHREETADAEIAELWNLKLWFHRGPGGQGLNGCQCVMFQQDSSSDLCQTKSLATFGDKKLGYSWIRQPEILWIGWPCWRLPFQGVTVATLHWNVNFTYKSCYEGLIVQIANHPPPPAHRVKPLVDNQPQFDHLRL